MVHLQRFSVAFEYPVAFTEDVFATDCPVLADLLARREPHRRHRVSFIIDRGVWGAHPLSDRIRAYGDAHAGRVELAGEPLVVDGGEAAKNDPRLVEALLERFASLRLDRHSFVIAVGGGAVLDLAGYAAAIAHRGIRLVRLPTTVLAQADSGVGVKNGINLFGKKNFIGTFAPPWAVVNDRKLLSSLPRRDVIAGMAEAVKVALIGDASFFEWISDNANALAKGDAARVAELVRRCAELHLRHIATAGDPFELGSARPLDFGHWAAHRLESLTAHRLRHGEAVSIGMAIDTLYSARAGLLAEGDARRVVEALERLGLPVYDEALELRQGSRRAVLSGLDDFREHLGGELTVTLLRAIGRGVDVHAMDEARLEQVFADLARRRP